MTISVREKIRVANAALATFATETQIEKRPSGWHVKWRTDLQGEVSRRWECRDSDFYPVWNREWPHGGTAIRAVAQLLLWVKGQPVFPIAIWKHWASEQVRLATPETLKILTEGGYPQYADCVLCDNRITGSMDWWHCHDLIGPCCSNNRGCRQQIGSSGWQESPASEIKEYDYGWQEGESLREATVRRFEQP